MLAGHGQELRNACWQAKRQGVFIAVPILKGLEKKSVVSSEIKKRLQGQNALDTEFSAELSGSLINGPAVDNNKSGMASFEGS
ncbi:MAG: hypothetical protein VST67_01960 [Nitrospirota bacterium]|nr:hypothetical protein [Nitrospirota bacterium]